ncbi:MAG: ATP-binding protein [Coprothermobacterota bacterium]|nr:ATP-binding protein [Coprothermobacterota bacterium]
MRSAKLFEILSNYNRFWLSGRIEAGVVRDILPACLRQVDSKEVVVIKGVHRCGKSTLMAQIIKALLARGEKPTAILRVNLEEPLFSSEYSTDLLEQIYRLWRERVQPEGRCLLFLDEVQNIPGWEGWVRGRIDTEDLKVFVTGSSSQLLSREVGTKLTGRQVSFEVFPLSFLEYLRFKGMEAITPLEYEANKAAIRRYFADYLQYGGFPEVVLKEAVEDKDLLLKNYFEDLLFRDIVARHEVRDVANLRNLAVYLLTNIARTTSINKLRRNFSISQDKTEHYVSAILESYLLSRLQMFSYSLKSTLRAGFKPYAVDTGLRNRVAFSFSEDLGWLAENVVYAHLVREHEEVYFLADHGETDFIVKEGTRITKRIQVWYEDTAKSVIPDREMAAFRSLSSDPKEGGCILITNDCEDNINVGDVRVACVPLVKFLLGL